ncbi:hypothetical protein ACQ4PT_061432 [Festuca glaucescens]
MDDPSHRREHGDDPPQYDNPNMFTVVFEHNGFFCGLKEYLDYASGTVDYFDSCNTETFSLLWIEDFIRQGGNEVTERTHIYWCLPGKGIRDGLCCIDNDSHIVAMMAAVQEEKELNLIVDHTNFLKGLREDVVVPIPSKYLGGNGNDIQDAEVGDGSDTADSEFYDSDWDAEDGDDDLFLDNVDKDVNDNNEPTDIVEQEDDAGLEHKDLNLSKEEYSKLTYKFKEFNAEVDMEAPVFKVGMLFSSMEEFRRALNSYSVNERVNIRKTRNESTRLHAMCEGFHEFGCP